jgi:hypothetical protein
MNLLPFFDQAIVALNRNKSDELGNRNEYIGSSDVSGCARKVHLQRQNPTQPDVCTLLKFARGLNFSNYVGKQYCKRQQSGNKTVKQTKRHPQQKL